MTRIALVCLTMAFLRINAIGQTKDVYSIDSVFLVEFHRVDLNAIGLNPKTNNYFVVGDFIATDDSSKSQIPYFYFELNTPAGDLHYYTSDFGVAFRPQSFGSIFDDNQNKYMFGTSNDTKILTKIKSNNQIDWTISNGHHSFKDFSYHDGFLYGIGQDEDSSARHVTMVTKIDTNGTHHGAMNFGNTFGGNLPVSIVANDDGVFLFSHSYTPTGLDIFAVKTDHNLSRLKSASFGKTGFDHVLTDVTLFNKEWYLTGYLQGNPDSSFLLKLDYDFNQQFFKTYSLDTAADSSMQANTIKITNDKSILIGGSLINSALRTSPFVMKLDSVGIPEWAHDYKTDSIDRDETVEDMILTTTNDSVLLAGKTRIYDSLTFLTPKFYVQKMDVASGSSGCFRGLDIYVGNHTLNAYDSISESTYFGTFGSLPFGNHLDFVQKAKSCAALAAPINPGVKENVPGVPFTVFHDQQTLTITRKNDKKYDIHNPTVNLLDLMGRTHLTKSVQSGKSSYSVPISHLSSGLYLVRIEDKNQFLQTTKIIIQH